MGANGVCDLERHRHGRRVHSHPNVGPHRHLAPGLRHTSSPARREHPPPHLHGEHSHGLVDESIKRSRAGLRAVSASLAVLAGAACVQAAIFVASGSVALLADLIHNFGDALTAVPLGTAFVLRSKTAEHWAGRAVVAAVFISACVAGVEAVERVVHPAAPTHLVALAAAGAAGYLGNLIAARIRIASGERLASAALVADGNHARADAYVSLGVVASALVVAVGIPVADPFIGLAITFVILRITWQSLAALRNGHN